MLRESGGLMRRCVLFATVAACVIAPIATAGAQTPAPDRFEVQTPRGSFEAAPLARRPDAPSSAGIATDASEIRIAPPDLPAVVVAIDPPFAPREDLIVPDIPPPSLPPVVVMVEQPSATPQTVPEAPKSTADALADSAAASAPPIVIAPPDLPEATVTVDAPPATAVPSELAGISAALVARLDRDGAPSHPRLTRALREEVAAFYVARGGAPLWVNGAGATARGRAIAAQLRRAAEDGLDSGAYNLPEIGGSAGDPTALAALDLHMSVAAVVYARDARGGRIDARRLSSLIDPTVDLPNAAETLQALAAANDAAAALQAFNPPHEGYRALRAKLREAREGAERVAAVTIPPGPVLRVGMSDARVALVRERLRIAPHADTIYDEAVAEAVSSFQRERGLAANGHLTRQTVAALSGSATPRQEADIIANMERWRWLPRDLGERHILVNIPEFQVRVVNGATVEHQARVIVGKPETPTPVFSDVMQFLVVNPSWFVPPSILKKEFLPKLASDPGYAERRGYQVIRRGAQISVRQPPGERNALGHVKFMFPNRHAVYLHDTPTRHLFGADRRAFSHGCVRVDQPFRLAEIVLGKERGWSEARVRGLVGRGEQSVRMEQKLPIHLTYFTTFVDDVGRLQQRDDLYGHNRRVRAALGLDG